MAYPNGRNSSFLERMRAPNTMGGSSWRYQAPSSAIRAGERDPIDHYGNLLELERRRDYDQSLRGNQGGWGQQRGLQQVGRGIGGGGWQNAGTRQMDVVYDQGPEIAQKALNQRKDEANQKQKNIEAERAIDAQRYNDSYIDNRRQRVAEQRAADTQMTDQAKLAMQFANAQTLEGQRGANNLAERNLQNQGAYNVALDGRREAARSAAELARINTEAKSADVKLAADVRREAANTPKAQSEAMDLKLRQLRITRPDLAAAFNSDGTLNMDADPNLLGEIERMIMPRREGDINLPSMGGNQPPPIMPSHAAYKANTEGIPPGPPTNINTLGAIGARPLARYETGKDPGNPNVKGTRLSNLPGQNSLSGGEGSPFLPITKPGATAESYAKDLQNAQKIRIQVNPKTGQRRESSDGGKTWRIVS